MFKVLKYRISLIKYTLEHRNALQKLAKKHGYSFPLHDLDKVILYLFLGKHYTQVLHRYWSSHHYRNGDIKDKVQAAFDWNQLVSRSRTSLSTRSTLGSNTTPT